MIHSDLDAAAREARIRSILEAVGLPDTHLDLYPHEISGGQQRRVGLARILTLHPKVVILDEPTSGLDVSVQATVLSLFRGLRETFDLTYILISHDLAVIRTMCSRVAVMYLGRIVESGPTDAIFDRPRHPYTRSLVAAIPRIGGVRVTRDFWLQGEPPDPGNLPSGCRFRTRCPKAADLCAREEPALSRAGAGFGRLSFPGLKWELVVMAEATGKFEIGVDIGGTFTDVVCRDGTGAMRLVKIPTTRRNPSAGVKAAMDYMQREWRVSPDEIVRFVHGTTVATNAVLEAQGSEDRPAHDRGLQGRARDRPPDAALGVRPRAQARDAGVPGAGCVAQGGARARHRHGRCSRRAG